MTLQRIRSLEAFCPSAVYKLIDWMDSFGG